MNALEEHTIENNVSAQKRAEVRLNSRRETAKRTVRRPADADTALRMPDEFLRTLLLTLLITAATLVLLYTRLPEQSIDGPGFQRGSTIFGWFDRGNGGTETTETTTETSIGSDTEPGTVGDTGATAEQPQNEASDVANQTPPLATELESNADSGSPTFNSPELDSSGNDSAASQSEDSNRSATVDTDVNLDADAPAATAIVSGEELSLLVDNNFTPPAFPFFNRDAFPLARRQDEGMWLMNFVPGLNVYRIRVFPGYVAWSTLGYELPLPFRVETNVTNVKDELIGPMGYSGLLARYQDPRNFYLFNVAGDGQSQLLSQIDGVWTTITPWTPTVLVNPAGTPNILAVEDDGNFLRFYVNGAPIHEVEAMLDHGLVGLAGGTKVQAPSESNFKWIRVYGKP